jgi:hypothetical protein
LVITLAWINGLPPHLENGTDHHLLASKEHKWMSGHAAVALAVLKGRGQFGTSGNRTLGKSVPPSQADLRFLLTGTYREWPAFLPCMAGLLHAPGLVPPATTAPASSHCVSVKSLGYMFSSDSPQTPTHIPCRVSFLLGLE